MKRLLLAALAAVMILGLASCEAKTETQSYAMDTFLTQELYGEGGSEASGLNKETVLDIENSVSSYIPGSEIYRLNSDGSGTLSGTAEDLFGYSLDAMNDTGCAFNPFLGSIINLWDIGGGNTTVPDDNDIKEALVFTDPDIVEYTDGRIILNGALIDLGGIAKGYALDRMAENCALCGVESGLIDFGGSIAAIGEKPGGGKWSVGIKDPNDDGDIIAKVNISNAFVSTSGIYERYFVSGGKTYHHIFDPATGYPADNGLTGVSVVSESGILTDCMSTALFVMGPDKGPEYAERKGIAAVFITSDGKVNATSAMKGYGFERLGQK